MSIRSSLESRTLPSYKNDELTFIVNEPYVTQYKAEKLNFQKARVLQPGNQQRPLSITVET